MCSTFGKKIGIHFDFWTCWFDRIFWQFFFQLSFPAVISIFGIFSWICLIELNKINIFLILEDYYLIHLSVQSELSSPTNCWEPKLPVSLSVCQYCSLFSSAQQQNVEKPDVLKVLGKLKKTLLIGNISLPNWNF